MSCKKRASKPCSKLSLARYHSSGSCFPSKDDIQRGTTVSPPAELPDRKFTFGCQDVSANIYMGYERHRFSCILNLSPSKLAVFDSARPQLRGGLFLFTR